MSNQMWLSRHSKGGKEPILYNDYQSAARANDTNYMLDAQVSPPYSAASPPQRMLSHTAVCLPYVFNRAPCL